MFFWTPFCACMSVLSDVFKVKMQKFSVYFPAYMTGKKYKNTKVAETKNSRNENTTSMVLFCLSIYLKYKHNNKIWLPFPKIIKDRQISILKRFYRDPKFIWLNCSICWSIICVYRKMAFQIVNSWPYKRFARYLFFTRFDLVLSYNIHVATLYALTETAQWS